ncbi:sensor histidine kinase [Paenibacillus cisolokensis]|uniref:sensor histidine kinase n=1 Tax=Paenibacillus cisolokensis TaxID=1658519 RepID=UPI003D29E0DE
MRTGWNSLFVKMLLMFFVLIVPLYGLGVWFTSDSSRQMRAEIERSNESVLQFHYSNLEFELSKMNSLLLEYSFDGELSDFSAMAPIMSNYEIARRLNSIWLKLRQMQSSSPYIEDVRYYLPALGKVVSARGGVSDSRAEDWRGLLATGASLSETVTEYGGGYYLAKSQPDLLDPSAAPNFLLVVELSRGELIRQLRSIRKEAEGGAFLLFGESGGALVSDESVRGELASYRPAAGARTGEIVRTETDDGYYYAAADDAYQFRLVSYVPKDALFKPIRRYSFRMLALTAVSCALIVAFTYGLYRIIHRPLLKLIRGFRAVERGDMTKRIAHRSGDEFEYLYGQFNLMQRRLHALIEENYLQRIRTQDAELKHLQSQIAPHFLYNSLFTIKQMAELENVDAIKEFSDYLGRYFRFMTRDFNKEVTLGEEMDHSVVYLRIQQIRFSNRIVVEAEPLEERYRPIRVPRIILQPILENVFMHGLAQKASGGVLRLTHREEAGTLVVAVEDNGAKLTDENLRRLRERLAGVPALPDCETTGLFNVHHRLKIRFGPEYGLALSRSTLGGLRAEIRLPSQPETKD